MAEQVTLGTFNTLQNSSIISTLNANNTLIEDAFEDCVSLSGIQPNAMQANLDMNSNQIINLPAPSTINSPIRVSDLASSSAINIVQAGQVIPQMFGAKADGVTDDTAALQAALNYIGINGGVLSLTSSTYYFTSGLTLSPVVHKNCEIAGPGILKASTGMTGTALLLTGVVGAGRPHITLVKEIEFDFTNNTGLTYGVAVKGLNNTQIVSCSFKTDNSGAWASNFATIFLGPSTPGDSNTCPFWTLIKSNSIAPFQGPTTFVPYGILMNGQVNATVIRDNALNNAIVGIAGLPDPINHDNSNAVFIHDNFIQGVTTAIKNTAANTPNSWGSGWNVWGNRIEDVVNFIDFEGTGSPLNSANPMYLHGNYLSPNVTNYLINPLSAQYSSFEPRAFGSQYVGSNTVITGSGMSFTGSTGGVVSTGNLISGMTGNSTGIAQVDIGCPGGTPTVLWDNGSTAGSLNFTSANVYQFKANTNLIGVLGSSPNTQTGGTYSVGNTDTTIIANGSGLVLTLPTPSVSIGRIITIRTSVNSTVTSASSNVSINSAAAGTAILAATAGKWAQLQSDGTNWVMTANN